MKMNTTGRIDTNEARLDFSKVVDMAEKNGQIVIFENAQPKLLVIDLEAQPQIEMTEDEKFEFVAARILSEHKKAFEELAK